jgi:hypothetical protein
MYGSPRLYGFIAANEGLEKGGNVFIPRTVVMSAPRALEIRKEGPWLLFSMLSHIFSKSAFVITLAGF